MIRLNLEIEIDDLPTGQAGKKYNQDCILPLAGFDIEHIIKSITPVLVEELIKQL